MSSTIRKHADVTAILHTPKLWSNQVSQHLNVPNGMDTPEHTIYRALIEPFFSAESIAQFEGTLRAVVANLFQNLPDNADVMQDLAYPFALRAQCAFMGWPRTLEQKLLNWIQQQRQASATKNREALAQLAAQFSHLMTQQFERARAAENDPTNVTRRLVELKINGQPLPDDYLVSIVRNWTVGELATIANAVAAIVTFLQSNDVVRKQLQQAPEHIDHAIDEILRFNAPLASNRRRARCPVHIAGQNIAADTVVTLDWAAANTDPEVFEQPHQFRWDRDPRDNLLYGAGIHVCPGAPLARLELREFTKALLPRLSRRRITRQDEQTLIPSGHPTKIKI